MPISLNTARPPIGPLANSQLKSTERSPIKVTTEPVASEPSAGRRPTLTSTPTRPPIISSDSTYAPVRKGDDRGTVLHHLA